MAGMMGSFSQMDPESRDAAMKMYKVAKGMKLEEIREKEDILPPDWEERATEEGQVYYVNLKTNESQLTHPKSGRTKVLEGDLPSGWEKKISKQGRTAFVNERENRVTYRDPRLAQQKKEVLEPQPKPSNYAVGATAMEILSGLDLSGWVILITGASSGIGFETARALAAHSAHIIMACRNVEKAEQAKAEICAQVEDAAIDVIGCDLASFTSIEECARTFLDMDLPLHVLVLNAAVYGPWYTLTPDTNLELTFAVNHMGHFYLTKLLTKRLTESRPSQVIVVSSDQHRRAADIGHFQSFSSDGPADLMLTADKLSPATKSEYYWSYSYFLSKLCNMWFCFQLNRRLMPFGVTSNAVNPGAMIRTELPRESCFLRAIYALVSPWTKTAQQAAASVVYAVVLPENVGGQYISNCCPIEPHKAASSHQLQDRLWEISEEIVKQFRSLDN